MVMTLEEEFMADRVQASFLGTTFRHLFRVSSTRKNPEWPDNDPTTHTTVYYQGVSFYKIPYSTRVLITGCTKGTSELVANSLNANYMLEPAYAVDPPSRRIGHTQFNYLYMGCSILEPPCEDSQALSDRRFYLRFSYQRRMRVPFGYR